MYELSHYSAEHMDGTLDDIVGNMKKEINYESISGDQPEDDDEFGL